MRQPKLVLLIFQSGKIILTGAKVFSFLKLNFIIFSCFVFQEVNQHHNIAMVLKMLTIIMADGN